MKFELSAAPGGVDARVSTFLRGSLGAAYKEMGQFFELYTVAGALKSRVAYLADQFVITDGAVNTLPFVFEGGIAKLNGIRVNSLDALSAVLGSVNIENAIIGNLQVQTSNIPVGAISVVAFNQQAGPVSFQPTYTIDVTINHGPDVQFVEVNASFGTSMASTRIAIARMYCVNDGAQIAGPVNSNAGQATMSLSSIHQPPARASSTYRLEVRENSSATGNAVAAVVITAKAFKR